MMIWIHLSVKFVSVIKGAQAATMGLSPLFSMRGRKAFNRIRIGVNRPAPGYNIADYVLSNFSKDEMKSIR